MDWSTSPRLVLLLGRKGTKNSQQRGEIDRNGRDASGSSRGKSSCASPTYSTLWYPTDPELCPYQKRSVSQPIRPALQYVGEQMDM